MERNNTEQMKEQMLTGPWYTIISPGNTTGHGGVLYSPFYDDILIDMWLELEDLSRDNFMVLKVTDFLESDDMKRNFTKDRLDNFVERHEYMSEEDWYEQVELFEEFKEHCEKILGKSFFKK